MNRWLYRVLRAAFIAAAAYIVYHVLDYFEASWLFLPFVLGLFFLGVLEKARAVYVRRKKESDWDRWENAIGIAEERPRAILEVREALRRSERFGPRLRQEQAHLSVILAELLDASGRPDEASRMLAKVNVDALTPAQAVVVRHARIVSYLSAGRIEDAEIALSVRGGSSGEKDMDARLDLLGAMIAIEKGDPDAALTIASEVSERLKGDETLLAEARVVRSAALDAKGERAAALEALQPLDESTLRGLEELGPKRVRALSAEVLASRASAAS